MLDELRKMDIERIKKQLFLIGILLILEAQPTVSLMIARLPRSAIDENLSVLTINLNR